MIRAQHQRLVPMLLSSQGAGHILTALHDFSALVVDAQDAGHTVAAGAALECWRNGFIVGNGPGAGSRPGREARYKGLLLRVTASFIALAFTLLLKLAYSAAAPFPARTASLGSCGGPLRLRLQRTGDPMQVPHLIPLIC